MSLITYQQHLNEDYVDRAYNKGVKAYSKHGYGYNHNDFNPYCPKRQPVQHQSFKDGWKDAEKSD